MTKASSERCRILIVDDNQQVRSLLAELIEGAGYDVACAADGQAGLQLFESFAPDLVISDVVMPVLDGLGLCRHIKDDQRTSDGPVILISGQAIEDSVEGLSAGADDYLSIPFRNEELLVKVARLAERRRVEKHLRDSEERYRRLVELSPEAIVVQSEGKLVYANPAAQRLWGAANADELIGRSILDLAHPDIRELVKSRVREVEELGSRKSRLNQKHVGLDGEIIEVEVTSMP